MSTGKIISTINQKGGVGKTTTSVNVITAMAAAGYNCLILDLDPQGNASTAFGIDISKRENNIYNVLLNNTDIEDSILKTEIPKLDIITSTVDLAAAEIEMSPMMKREFILKSKLDSIKDNYDYIIIDCPPSLGLITLNALVASDSLIIPIQCEFFALEGLSHLLKTITLVKQNLNEDLYIEGALLTMYDKRNNLTEQVESEVRNFLGDKVYKTVIPRNIKISESPSHGKPVILYDFRCVGSLAYISLVQEILKKNKIKKTTNA